MPTLPLLFKRADSGGGDFSSGSIAGTIIGLVAVVLLFLAAAWYLFRHRAKKRKNARNAVIYNNPATMNERLRAYDQQQRSRIRSSNARRASSVGTIPMSESRGRWYGAPPSNYSASPGPPPSYKATVSRPERVLMREP